MTSCVSNPTVDVTSYYQEPLKCCYEKWMHSVPPTNKWTVCIHYSRLNSVAIFLSKMDECLILCRRQFISTTKTEELTDCPASTKNKIHSLSSFIKTISTQTSGSVFAVKIDRVKRTENEFELIKTVDCFLDCQGNYTSSLVPFERKIL